VNNHQQELIQQLRQNHSDFAAFLMALSPEEFTYQKGVKWSAGQQLQHINLTLKPVVFAFGLPKWLLGWKFGKSNRPSKTYTELVAKYRQKLTTAGAVSKAYTPGEVAIAQRETLLKEMDVWLEKLSKKIAACSNEQLQRYILPHPLLGKLTLQEMVYFSTYHVQHHLQLVTEQLAHR
jgi:hypothetical protein